MPSNWPMDINTCETQTWVKDFIWRVVEELMEFYEAFVEEDRDHKIDELSDALHFFTEIYVILGYDSILLDNEINQIKWSLSDNNKIVIILFNIIYELGMASNALKNRKWKKNQVLVDQKEFYERLNIAYFHLIDLILSSFTEKENNKESLLNLYHLKNKVNQFRIRSEY